jgi:prepilin-type N-terminal cleavage/methylation domain-containing protein
MKKTLKGETMKTNRKSGFTLLEIMIVVAFIGLLAALAIPAMQLARAKSMTTSCVNNLRQISAAVDQYGFENLTAVPTFVDLVPDYIRKTPICPGGGTYTVDDPAVCDVAPHVL